MGSRNLIISIILLVGFLTAWVSVCLSIEPIPNMTNTIFGSMKLKEEINLTGATLKEILGEAPKLSGLKEVSLKTYQVPEAMSDTAMEVVSKGYRSRLTDEGWQMILMNMDKNRIIMIFGQEKEGAREKLMVVLINSSEVSEMVLTGKIELSALEELRNVILRSVPKFDNLQPIAEFFRAEPSPSQEPDYYIRRLEALAEEQGDQTPPETYLYHGEAYEQLGNYENALEQYNSLIKKPDVPDSLLLEAYYRAGFSSERLGKFDDAKRYYGLLLERFGGKEGHALLAETALRRLEKAQDESSTAKMLMDNAETMFYKLGDIEAAIEAYKTMVNSFPDSSYAESATLMIGLAYGHLKQPEKQIETFEKAVKNYPSAISHTYLGMAYQDTSRYKEALDQYKTVLKDYPNASVWLSVNAYYGAGECSQKLGMTEDAKGYYKELVEKFRDLYPKVKIADAEKELLKIERGGALPFLGLGFRYGGSKEGALIVTVFKNGPSKAAGVQRGDVLLAVDSQKTPDPDTVVRIIANKNIGDKVTLLIKRKDETIEIPVTLMATPEKLERF